MKRVCVVACGLWLISFFCNAQEGAPDLNDKQVRLNAFLGTGRSTFKTNMAAPSTFPTVEFRLGAGVTKPLTEIFDLRARLTFGAKLKRKALNEQGQPFQVGSPFIELDEAASSRNHYFYEVPLLLQANVRHPKIALKAGANVRHYFPINDAVDFLTARNEFGVIAGASYRLSETMSLGLEYYFGLTKVYTASGHLDSSEFSMNVRNEFAQVTFEYTFPKK
jgi:hypothetical protein